MHIESHQLITKYNTEQLIININNMKTILGMCVVHMHRTESTVYTAVQLIVCTATIHLQKNLNTIRRV